MGSTGKPPHAACTWLGAWALGEQDPFPSSEDSHVHISMVAERRAAKEAIAPAAGAESFDAAGTDGGSGGEKAKASNHGAW